MKQNQGTFVGAQGLDLFYQSWLPEDAARAVLAILPGMGDHSGRYGRIVPLLVERGVGVYIFDLRGFGRSPGRRGHVDRFAQYRQDTGAFLQMIARLYPDAPRFLMGYSLGSAIALDYVLQDPNGLRGVILSATPIEPAGIAKPWQVALAKAFSAVWPTFSMPLGNDINGVSRDPVVLDELRRDPLHHDRVTARWGAEVLAATERQRQQAAQIRLPVLFIHGGDDPFNLARGVERYAQQITYPDKSVKIYPGSRHETHNDLDYAQVAADIADWMAERSAVIPSQQTGQLPGA